MRSRTLAVLAVVAALGAACGDDGSGAGPATTTTGVSAPPPTRTVRLDAVPVANREAPDDDPTLAGDVTTDLGMDLYEALADDAGDGDNIVLSPASIAIALGMLEPGTVDEAQDQLRELLGIDDAQAFHGSMNALEQDLEAREPSDFGSGSDTGDLAIRIANAAYLQHDFPFEPDYLDTIGRFYGPVLNQADFASNPDGVAHEINAWVEDQTEGHIVDLVPDGVLDDLDVLALVNAIYLHASWLQPFDEADTASAPFTRVDDREVDVPLMNGFGDSSAAGDGWVGATKDYTGSLSAQFILPDEGRFDEVAADLASVLDEYEAASTDGAELVVPRFEARFDAELTGLLQRLGLTAAYDRGHLLGIADDDRLVLGPALHQAWLAMDEHGTEAAAATVLIAELESGPPSPPVPVILDRPFLYRIFDTETGATLFLGRVMDPTA
jgi:serine protease inhibitor